MTCGFVEYTFLEGIDPGKHEVLSDESLGCVKYWSLYSMARNIKYSGTTANKQTNKQKKR